MLRECIESAFLHKPRFTTEEQFNVQNTKTNAVLRVQCTWTVVWHNGRSHMQSSCSTFQAAVCWIEDQKIMLLVIIVYFGF